VKKGSRKNANEIGKLTGKKDGRASWAVDRWHQLDAKPFPPQRSDFDVDLGRLIRESVIPGSTPPEPMLGADSAVITLGSCFARELREHLASLGFASRGIWVPSGLNNTFAILDFVSWCVTGRETGGGYRYDRTAEGAIEDWRPATEREKYLEAITSAGGFVFTIGLAEVWEDAETAAVFWKGVPEPVFDADRHRFRLSTVEENERNLVEIVELVRRVNESAPIVLTLSPVPLKATFRDVSCIVADSVSKSILRVAVDRVASGQVPGVYYWPSFEIVRWLGAHRGEASYGVDDNRSRHVNRASVREIIEAFVESFYAPEAVVRMRAGAAEARGTASA
jgi:hypothetical protein